MPLSFLSSGRPGRARIGRRAGRAQSEFPFRARARRVERTFKLVILGATLAVLAALVAGTFGGRYLAGWAVSRARAMALQAIGLPPDRDAIDADWKRRRLFDVHEAARKHAASFGEYNPAQKRLLEYAGLDPAHALIRWGNFNKTVLLPSTIFEPDETGRSYRFRPNVRSIWIRNFPMKGEVKAFFQVVQAEGVADLLKGTGASLVEGSEQTTNSWGLRGDEPDPSAQRKGIVLGDSYMQGLFVGDHDTPSEQLERVLAERLHTHVEILNTGCLGYSPEQYYYSLLAFADRFPPSFVVVSVFANDFGDLFEALEGRGDWDESAYWLEKIREYCFSRRIVCLVVPAPWVNQIEGPLRSGNYPGMIANRLNAAGMDYLDPISAFASAQLEATVAAARGGQVLTGSPRFNGRIGDGHFSPLGAGVWARAVARRLVLLIENREARGPSAGANSAPANPGRAAPR